MFITSTAPERGAQSRSFISGENFSRNEKLKEFSRVICFLVSQVSDDCSILTSCNCRRAGGVCGHYGLDGKCIFFQDKP